MCEICLCIINKKYVYARARVCTYTATPHPSYGPDIRRRRRRRRNYIARTAESGYGAWSIRTAIITRYIRTYVLLLRIINDLCVSGRERYGLELHGLYVHSIVLTVNYDFNMRGGQIEAISRDCRPSKVPRTDLKT